MARVFIRAIQGMEFLAHTGAWDPKDQAAVHKWFEEYLHWLTHSKKGQDEKNSGNNHASWWTAQTAAVATFVRTSRRREWRSTITATTSSRARFAPMAARRAKRRAPARSPIRPSTWKPSPPPAASRRSTAWICGASQAAKGATIATVIEYLRPYLAGPQGLEQGTDHRFPEQRPLLPGLRRHGTEKSPIRGPLSQTGAARGAFLSPGGSDRRPLGSGRPPDTPLISVTSMISTCQGKTRFCLGVTDIFSEA